ncbi:unnamed protein product [Anisakis simplex]|uniref:Biotin--protein ligase (inferred by orthology to a human protein) n=1 Tax=Anisakis simplex TaxID=6269 RepID=A0A0M3JWV4_ANISI|nr:unnamed protein product [Anisakis simplex]
MRKEEKERDKNCSTITELGNTLSSKQSSHMSSRFTTTAVREEDFAEVSSLDKQQCSLLQSVQPEKNMDDNFSSSEFVADAKEISDAHERNHSKSTVPSVPKQNNISNLEDATQTTATKLLTLIDNQGHKKTVPINLSLAQDYPRSALEILQQRRHSSMLPRLRDDFSLDPSLKSIRRHSLSPITSAFEHPSMHLSRVPIFSPESFRRPSFMPTRRRFHSIAPVEKAQAKPPTILVYTGDNNELFNGIASSLSTMISSDTYTIFHLSKEALRDHPWISNETACLLIADTKTLDDKSWARLQHYFNNSGKMIFICQNSLLASLSSCETSRKSVKMLKMAFGERHTSALGKDFETFLKKTLKMIAKHKKVQ